MIYTKNDLNLQNDFPENFSDHFN
jgi:senataxin